MTAKELQNIISKIEPADRNAMERARKRQAELAKPPDSLGTLEDISVKLAGISGKVCNEIKDCCVLVFAADNGVICEGVSSAPKSVSLRQCLNMLKCRTGMSAIASGFGDAISVTDVGLDADGPWEGIADCKIRHSTGNIAVEAAMKESECLSAIAVGIGKVKEAKLLGYSVVGIGEMGIGNTTTSSAVLSALTDVEPSKLTGRGGGLCDEAFEKKIKVIEKALRLHNTEKDNVISILSRLGGLDIAAMTGAYIGSAFYRIPAVVDGFISLVASLCAYRLCPSVKDYIFLSHISCEPGYATAASVLGLEPALKLNMCLGEGSGCPLMFRIMEAACFAMNNMATFREAEINDDYLSPLRKQAER